jgi:hypothetical protein
MAECYNSLLLFGKFFLFWYNWTKKNLATLDRRTCADKTRTEKNATDNFFREIKIVGSLLFWKKHGRTRFTIIVKDVVTLQPFICAIPNWLETEGR